MIITPIFMRIFTQLGASTVLSTAYFTPQTLGSEHNNKKEADANVVDNSSYHKNKAAFLKGKSAEFICT